MSLESPPAVKTANKSAMERTFVVLTSILGTYPRVKYAGDTVHEKEFSDTEHVERLLNDGMICLPEDKPRVITPWDVQKSTVISHGGDGLSVNLMDFLRPTNF